MNIVVTSLTDHRIDVLFAHYIEKAFSSDNIRYEELIQIGSFDVLIVTNGVLNNSSKCKSVVEAMKTMPSIYLIDDHTCWIPDLLEFPKCKILSQFTKHPLDSHTDMQYFQVSALALFDSKFDSLVPTMPQDLGYSDVKTGEMVYWGQYKEERFDKYVEHIPKGCTVIGRRYPFVLSKNWAMLPFTKNMDELHSEISKFRHTMVFGDDFHDGVNFPYRIYEAFMCGVKPWIDRKLIGDRVNEFQSALEWLYNYLEYGNTHKDAYKENLAMHRNKVYCELKDIITSHLKELNTEIVGEAKSSEELSTVDAILADRGSVYGSYYGGVECRASMMEALNNKHIETKGCDLPESVRVVFSDILLKLMRAASDPMHEDSWVDLAGYSKIIQEMFEENPYVFKG